MALYDEYAPTEELRELLKRAIEHMNADEKEQAKECVDKLLAADPDNLTARVILSDLAEWSDPAVFEHIMFVLDRDINYTAPFGYHQHYGDKFIDLLFQGLRGHLYREDPTGGMTKDEIRAKYIEYATRLLAADRPIYDVRELCEIFDEVARYDDVVKIAQFAIGEVTAEELGWPGLKKMRDLKLVEEIASQAADAFDATGRFEEGARWIFRANQQFPDSCYMWRLLADALCWVGYPEEAARSLIVALKKGYSPREIREFFEPIAEIIQNPSSPEVDELRSRLFAVKDKITPEQEPLYKDLLIALNRISQREGTEPLSPEYIEHQLGMKLPYVKHHRRPVVLPKVRSNAPFVQEIIAYLDKVAGAVPQATPSVDSPVWARQQALKTAEQEREKVKVGGDAGPSPGQQGFALYQFGIDVTEQAQKGEMPPIVGRDREIERMIRILVRTEKNNPILLGEAGVGKTAVVHGLAQRIVAGTVPPVLQGRRVIELNMGVLVAGTTYRGDFEQRIVNIVKETRNNPNIILFIDEMHTLMGAGDGWDRGLDASNMMKPALANGELRLIGATTAAEYARSIEKDPALDRRFSPIWLKEIDQEMTLAVLRARQPRWQKHHGVEIAEELLRVAVQLTEQHVRHRHFPDKAIDLIDEACALARVAVAVSARETTTQIAERAADDRSDPSGEPRCPVILTQQHLRQVVDEWSGATSKDAEGTGDPAATSILDEIVFKLRQQVVGHEQNLKRLAAVVADEKLGLRMSRLPRVLLFCGRPNSGKTETARALTQVLWPGERDRFLFINMAPYADPARITQLIGVPPGYAGSNETGLLSLHLRQQPHSVVYLCSFHKAHERILRLFANLFTEGSFQDARGQSVFAGNSIFILSATLDDAPQQFGFGAETSDATDDEPEITSLLDNLDLPDEILNSAKDIFWFGELNESDTIALIRRQIEKIASQPSLRGFGIQFDGAVVQELLCRYRQQPASSRNLKALINQVAFPYVRQRMVTEGH
jgi:ATP-dependent Clp protease ATP-binding subunit ClpC